ncbi:MAG: hypothetical protein J0I19_03680 [Alphaproteobacteria bacterium]|nr:hypothetical protein [Alphaproteobacteria bacterium]
MNAFRLQVLAALACLALSAVSFQPSLAYDGSWHVVENLSAHACYRVTRFSPTPGWVDFGRFDTFRMAGAWVWRHRDICRYSPVFG